LPEERDQVTERRLRNADCIIRTFHQALDSMDKQVQENRMRRTCSKHG